MMMMIIIPARRFEALEEAALERDVAGLPGDIDPVPDPVRSRHNPIGMAFLSGRRP